MPRVLKMNLFFINLLVVCFFVMYTIMDYILLGKWEIGAEMY